MNIPWSDNLLSEYLFWQTNDKKINTLIKVIKRDSYDGIRKPEQEKHELLGCMSRRITEEHRLRNEVYNSTMKIISCSYHY